MSQWKSDPTRLPIFIHVGRLSNFYQSAVCELLCIEKYSNSLMSRTQMDQPILFDLGESST